jgi:hypothetical protein
MTVFDAWMLIVGLVVGGAVVGVMTMDPSRRDHDVGDDEAAAEATFIAARLASDGRAVDAQTVAAVLRGHRAYLNLPPPDAIVPSPGSAADGHPDHRADDVGHGRRAEADGDLPPA